MNETIQNKIEHYKEKTKKERDLHITFMDGSKKYHIMNGDYLGCSEYHEDCKIYTFQNKFFASINEIDDYILDCMAA